MHYSSLFCCGLILNLQKAAIRIIFFQLGYLPTNFKEKTEHIIKILWMLITMIYKLLYHFEKSNHIENVYLFLIF